MPYIKNVGIFRVASTEAVCQAQEEAQAGKLKDLHSGQERYHFNMAMQYYSRNPL